MRQSRRMSAVETATNIILGYAVSVGLQLAVFPAIGLSVTPLQSLQMGGAFTLASVLRGAGNMAVPSLTLFAVALLQVALGGALGLGWGPFPRLGMAGVAAGGVVAYGAGAAWLWWTLASGRSRMALNVRGTRFQRALFADILRVGAVACISPLQTVLTILILTRLVAQFGTDALAGYGIGTRLEFLLVPVPTRPNREVISRLFLSVRIHKCFTALARGARFSRFFRNRCRR